MSAAAVPAEAASGRAASVVGLLDDALPAAFAVLVEGAWIAVIASLIDTARDEPIALGLTGMAGFAAIGLVAARVMADRMGEAWPGFTVGLVGAAAVAGWLSSDAARSALLAGNLGEAIGRHQAGFLAGLALLRGMAHTRPGRSERTSARLLAWGTPALAIPLIIARALPPAARDAFEAQALGDCLAFVLAGAVGLALTRMVRLGRSGAFDWRHNRAWWGLTAVVCLAALLALPAAPYIGPAIQFGVVFMLPFLIGGAILASLGETTRRTVAIVLAFGLLLLILVNLPRINPADQNRTQPGPVGPAGAGSEAAPPSPLIWLPIAIVAAVVIVLLVRAWMRRTARARPLAEGELREVDPASGGPSLFGGFSRPSWWPGRRSQARPDDAIAAYLATLERLHDDPEAARRPDESPAAHAKRLRSEGRGAPALDLLAADYQLARFGGEPLTSAEHRRAIDRWRRLGGPSAG